MKKFAAAIFLLLPLSSAALADFSRSGIVLHPTYPGSGPFILEIAGTWPTDCHPGEQLPVVKSFDGSTIEIEYEFVVIHITCNHKDTSYRSFVDLSDVLRKTKPLSDVLDVRVAFGDATLGQRVALTCPDGNGCTDPGQQRPLLERGLYVTADRAREGLLVARQDGATVMYPLVYGDTGEAMWLFSAGRVLEDTYFADLSLWSGGDCFDCAPTGAEPEMAQAGHLSVLIESPDRMRVKINDRPFSRYRRLVYGYQVFDLQAPGVAPLADLEGRWALGENRGTDPPLGDLTNFLPPAFDIALEAVTPAPDGPPAIQEVRYLMTEVTGEALGHLFCAARETAAGTASVCEFFAPGDPAEPLLLFHPVGPSSLSIEYGRPVIAVGVPPGGRAVRLD